MKNKFLAIYSKLDYSKEYNEFMLKLVDKANELRKDFNNLSLENQARVKKDISNIALGEFLNYAKNNFQQ